VILNLTDAAREIPGAGPGRVLVGTLRDREDSEVGPDVHLRPNEAVVLTG
jgi:hypothetical protein